MEGRCLWVKDGDVDGPLDEGHVVKATRTLNDWCLRADDGGEPVEAGALLEIVEVPGVGHGDGAGSACAARGAAAGG